MYCVKMQRSFLIFVSALALAVSSDTSGSSRVIIEEDLSTFLGTLEKYEKTKNDVVFLLDESGSIEAKNFPQVKLLTELFARRLSVSADDSRIAILTFSTEPRQHVDYIKNWVGHNMCTLIAAIEKIDYFGGWTHTDLAMKAAKKIFDKARNDTNKIIVLITDGQSNDGYSPVRISQKLKEEGFIIFAVGVADVNEAELEAVATSKEHIYILKNFEYIYEVNKYLKEDTIEVGWDIAKHDSLCNSFCSSGSDCCDVNANCYCGTKGGRYECACQAGFYGNGHQGECYMCPKGMFKDKAGNHKCKACPPYSTTKETGSISVRDCLCLTGYEGNPERNVPCTPVKCAQLVAPKGGVIFPANCSNVYGSQCSFKCIEGFCPYFCDAAQLSHMETNPPWNQVPAEPRTCLASSDWSGVDFHCEKIRCPLLEFPGNGTHNCSGSDMQFISGTTCQFSCDKGYDMEGSQIRTCLQNGLWSGSQVTCNVVHCDPLKVNEKLKFEQKECGVQSMPYRSICQYTCKKGFSLTSSNNISTKGKNKTLGVNECLADKTWSGAKEHLYCADSSPPNIKCPESITKITDPDMNYATVIWDIPVATDNMYVQSVKIKHPSDISKPPHAFSIGDTKVVYEAVDSSGLNDTCSFTVRVLDVSPPKVLFCPADIEVYHDLNKPIPVSWPEPKFFDNSNKIKNILSNREKASFSWGPPSVIYYNASDPSDNIAVCKFSVKVKPYPCPYQKPPENGVLTCDNWMDGRMCSVFCQDGYEFTHQPEKVYVCDQRLKTADMNGTWGPLLAKKGSKFIFPWPDCVKIQELNTLNVTVEMKYAVPNCNAEMLQKMKEKFIENLMPFERFFPRMFCPKDKGCHLENVNVTCLSPSRHKRSSTYKSVDKQILWKQQINYFNNKHHRVRHSNLKRLSKRRRSTTPNLSVSFNFQLEMNKTEIAGNNCENCDIENIKKGILENPSSLLNSVQEQTSNVLYEVYKVPSIAHSDISFSIVSTCSAGQVRKNDSCLSCPPGMYKNDLENTCVECPSATYQDKESSLSCQACPKGCTTYQTKSTSLSDCKIPCQQGYYSKTTFEPCVACPQNTYQEKTGSKECKKCLPGLSTLRVGANSSSDCVSPCTPGSYSVTGFQPCTLCPVGFYQAHDEQSSCNICPNKTSTLAEGSLSVEQCQEMHFCETLKPCPDVSICIDTGDSYICICPEGLLGNHCEINIDECSVEPCINNGTCIDGLNNYTCSCPDGFSGLQCETNIDDCKLNPCDNEGECIDLVGDYNCLCKSGFTGRNCEVNIYDCEFNPCQNGGICFDMIDNYRCCCSPGYYGNNCELELDPCSEPKCLNGGTCISTSLDSFECSCPTGFSGDTCDTNIDECELHSCYNGGTCVDGFGSATCICPQIYNGNHCEEVLLPEFALNYPSPVTSNYVELENDRRLSEVTVSFFMRTNYKDANSRATPMSYSYFDKETEVEEDNAFTLLDLNRLVFYLHGQPLHTGYSANSDSLWHHYALTWEKYGGQWAFYVDGNTIVSGSHVGELNYFWPGIFILGQEQDSLGGTFSISESFVGNITQFNVWDKALTKEEIKQVMSACSFVGNVISWPLALKNIHGDVSITKDVALCNEIGFCSKDDCKCFSMNYTEKTESFCNGFVGNCEPNPCANEQSCSSYDNQHIFCNCGKTYEGRFCQYDVNECLVNNGNCSHLCINDKPSYHCSCPDGMVLMEDKYTCKDISFCKHEKSITLNGAEWDYHCQNCICNNGDVICSDKKCPDINCLSEETQVLLPGECCERCVFLPAFCLISDNNTVTTFGGETYEFTDSCQYSLVENCVDGNFKIDLEAIADSSTLSERTLIIFVLCTKVNISLGLVEVNDVSKVLPFKNDDVSINAENSSINIWTRFGFTVQWHSSGEVIIAMPDKEIKQLCGVCGKFNIEESSANYYYLPERTASGPDLCYLKFEKMEEKIEVSCSPIDSGMQFVYMLCYIFLSHSLLQYYH